MRRHRLPLALTLAPCPATAQSYSNRATVAGNLVQHCGFKGGYSSDSNAARLPNDDSEACTDEALRERPAQ